MSRIWLDCHNTGITDPYLQGIYDEGSDAWYAGLSENDCGYVDEINKNIWLLGWSHAREDDPDVNL